MTATLEVTEIVGARAVAAETVRAGEVCPAAHRWLWVAHPTLTDGGRGWANGLLLIDRHVYHFAAQFQAPRSGEVGREWVIVDLRKAGETATRTVVIDPAGGATCDCEQAAYRQCRCKHAESVRAAVAEFDAELEGRRTRGEAFAAEALQFDF